MKFQDIPVKGFFRLKGEACQKTSPLTFVSMENAVFGEQYISPMTSDMCEPWDPAKGVVPEAKERDDVKVVRDENGNERYQVALPKKGFERKEGLNEGARIINTETGEDVTEKMKNPPVTKAVATDAGKNAKRQAARKARRVEAKKALAKAKKTTKKSKKK